MTKEQALELIDNHKNKLLNPVKMLHWTWLRVIILNLSDEAWEISLKLSLETLSR